MSDPSDESRASISRPTIFQPPAPPASGGAAEASTKKLFGGGFQSSGASKLSSAASRASRTGDILNRGNGIPVASIDIGGGGGRQKRTSTFANIVMSKTAATGMKAYANAKTGDKEDMFLKLARPGTDLEDQIRIGDQLLLGCVSDSGMVDCIVTADGFFTESANVVEECSYYYLATFRVTPALQYDALSEHTTLQRRPSFQDALTRSDSAASRPSLTSRPSFNRSVSQVQRSVADANDSLQAVEDERKKNSAKLDKLLKDTKEQAKIHYADDFQLQHVASGKFLTATARGAFTVTDGGTKNSIFRAKPRYRFREDGDGVLYADEVLLNVANYGSQMLSVTTPKAGRKGGRNANGGGPSGKQLVLKEQRSPDEVSISLSSEVRSFSFRFNKVARYTYDKAVPNPVKTDRMLKLWCHEARGVLCAPHDPISEDQNAYAETSKSGIPATMDSEELAFFATSIWQLEEEHAATGSIVYWEKRYRLRHSLSLRYLSIGRELKRSPGAVGTEILDLDTTYYEASLISAKDMELEKERLNPASPDFVPNATSTTLFKFKNTELAQNRVMNLDDCTFRMFNEQKKEVLGPDNKPTGKTAVLKCYLHFDQIGFQFKDTSKEIKMCFQTRESTEDTFHVQAPDTTFQTHLRTLRAFQNGMPEASIYIKAFEILDPKNNQQQGSNAVYYAADRRGDNEKTMSKEEKAKEEKAKEKVDRKGLRTFLLSNDHMLKSVKTMLQVMITTCIVSNKDLTGDMTDEDYMELQGVYRKDFQDLARESKALEALMAMILAPINCKNKTIKDLKNWETRGFAPLRAIQDLCFKLLRVLVDGNEATELYIAEKYCAFRYWPSSKKQLKSPTTAKLGVLEWPWYDYAFPSKALDAVSSAKGPKAGPGRRLSRSGGASSYEEHIAETWVYAIIFCARNLSSAQACLSTLLSNNEELLDKFVDDDVVDSFIDNIQERGPEYSTMDFFHAICSCKGRQILSNQELCLKKLLHDGETRIQLMVETTTFPVEMFDFTREQIEKQIEPTFDDFIQAYEGMPDLKLIFNKASQGNAAGSLGLKELRNALKEYNVELSRKDIKFVLERADNLHHDGLIDFDEFKKFIITHLHPEWEIGFVRSKEYARRHERMDKQAWRYATEDLVKTQAPDVADPMNLVYPYRARVKNQWNHFTSGDAKEEPSGKANRAFTAPSAFLGDVGLVAKVKEGNKDYPFDAGDIVKAQKTEGGHFYPAIVTKKTPGQVNVKFHDDVDEQHVKASMIKKEVLQFDPVFLGWTAQFQWEAGLNQLFYSPSALGLVDDFGAPYTAVKNHGALLGSDTRAWVPIERLCWVLDPKKLFMKVMLPRVFEQGPLEGPENVPTLESYIQSATPAVVSALENEGGEDERPSVVKARSSLHVQQKPNMQRIRTCYQTVFKKNGMKTRPGVELGELKGYYIPQDDTLVGEGTEFPTPKCADDVDLWWYTQHNIVALITGFEVEQLDDEGQDCFDKLERLAKYYQSQIFLFAEMCLNRSYNSIYEMQRQFSFEMLISLIGNDLLPDALRSAFTLVLLRVYIDRYPHAPIQAPGPMQVFNDPDNISGEMVVRDVSELNGPELLADPGNGADGKFGILPQFHIPRDGPLSKGRVGTNMNLASLKFLMFGISDNEIPGQKFYLVEEFVTTYLLKLGGRQDPHNPDRNKFVLSILDVVQALVKYGFYGTYYELMDVTTPLVEMLNGSKDIEGDATDANPIRYSKDTDGNMLVMDSKRAIIQSLMDLNRLRDDYRQKILMAYLKQSLMENEGDIGPNCLFIPSLLADKIAADEKGRIAEETKKLSNEVPSVSLLDLIKKEQALTKNGLAGLEAAYNEEVEAKLQQQMKFAVNKTDASSDTRDTKHQDAVEWVLSSYCQHRINDIFEEIESGKGKLKTHDYAKLDLDIMSPSEDLTAICMDLMMYDSPELFEGAHSLLWSQFAQRQPVIEALQDVMLLESPTLYGGSSPLIVQWLVDLPAGELHRESIDQLDLFTSRCTLSHVKHLKSFRQLLRRGVEAYELWGKHDTNASHFHTAYNDGDDEAYTVLHGDPKAAEHAREQDKKNLAEKNEWYLKNVAYLTLFMKFMTTKEGAQSRVIDHEGPIDVPMNTTNILKSTIVPDQKKYILDVEEVIQVVDRDEESSDMHTETYEAFLAAQEEKGTELDSESIKLDLLDPLTSEINRLHQNIIYGFNIQQVLLAAVQIPIHKGSSANTYRCLRQIVALSLNTLRLFVLRNKKNQNTIYESIDVILKLIENNCKGRDGQGELGPRSHPLDKPAPPSKSEEWDLDGWTYQGVDLIDLVEAHAVDLICELFAENPELCEEASRHLTLFETMRDLVLRRLPDLRALRFFHLLSAHGTPDTKARIVQVLTQQTSEDGKESKNVLISKYLHRLKHRVEKDRNHHDTTDEHLKFQAMLISTLAFCCADSDLWTKYSQPGEDSAAPITDAYTSTKNQLQGFVSIHEIHDMLWYPGEVLYDLKANKILDFSGMNLAEAGFNESDLAIDFIFNATEIKNAGFGGPQEPRDHMQAWITKQKIWQTWIDTASDAEILLQTAFLRLLTALYLNNKVLNPILEQDRGNQLPEFVDLALCETMKFDMEAEPELYGMGTFRKNRMSAGVLPMIYTYFQTVHPKNEHPGVTILFPSDPAPEDDFMPTAAYHRMTKQALSKHPRPSDESNLPIPGTPEVETTLGMESRLTNLMCRVHRAKTPKFTLTSQYSSPLARVRSHTFGSRIRDDDDVTSFGYELKNKHLAFDLLMKRMTENKEVLFVSEAKADLLNKQRKALGMKEVPNKTRVSLMAFLVFEVQKLELAPRWPQHPDLYEKDKHDFFCHNKIHGASKRGFFSVGVASDDPGEKYGWISPLYPTYDTFLLKMINHVKDFLNKDVMSGYDTRLINIQIMNILSELLGDYAPMNYEDEETEHMETSEAAVEERKAEFVVYGKKQLQIGKLGAVSLVLDVISDCDPRDQETLCGALELGKQLLNGGNAEVQDLIIEHFKKEFKDGHEFFIKIRDHLEGLAKVMKHNPDFIKEYTEGETNNPDSLFGDKIGLIFEFLQLWAEGHNRTMQEFLLGQDANTVALKKSTNVIALVVKVFDTLTSDTDMLRGASVSTIELLEKNMAFVVEVMQGPCTKVQNYVVDETAIVVYAKRVIALVHKEFDRKGGLEETSKRFKLMKTLITAIKVITSLMEGRGGDDDQKVYTEVMESMSTTLFRNHAMKVFSWKNYIENGIKAKELEKNGVPCLQMVCSKVYNSACSSDSGGDNAAEEKLLPWVEAMTLDQLDQMLGLVKESAAELYTVYMQLGSINKSFLNEVTNTAGNPEFLKAYTFIDQSIKSIEFIWSGPRAPPGTSGRVDKLYFQLPPASKALTTASKTKLFEEVNMDTDEDKKRDFLIRAKDLVAEMQHLDEVSKDPAFRFIQQNIGEIRSLSFSIAVALNVLLALSVSGGGNSGFDNQYPEGYDYDKVHIRMGAPRHLFYILNGLVILGYMLCFIYQMMIRAPLIRANYLRKRNQKAAMDDDDDDDSSTAQPNQPMQSMQVVTSAPGEVVAATGDSEDNPASPTQEGGQLTQAEQLAKQAKDQVQAQMDATQKAAKEKMDQTQRAAKEAAAQAHAQMRKGLSALAGDPRIRRYVWKLFKTTIPFFRAVAGLMVLVLIIAFTPSRPANSPAEWGWIILAVFLGTINVFFPTMMAFINELKHFPGEPVVYTLWVKSCEEFGAGFTALTELENFIPFVMMYFAIHGMVRFYMCSLLLLDVIFLNERLKNVIRAITYTASDLAVTFILMAFVVFIFTAFGMYEFGEMIWYESDEFQAVQMDDQGEDFDKGVIYSRDDDNAAFSLCPNLAVCFLEFFDSGLRSGDIVDAAFDDLTYRDNLMGYFGRIVFGLAFFLVIGVILFDIVTGIIIDKFGELREETATRLEKIKNSTFIADIERSTCDENGLDFDDINAHDQDMWNYVYLMAYLEFKDEDEYTGAESMIAEAIEKWDISWMPQKMCWAMQLKKISAELEDSDDLISQAKDDIINDSDTKLGDLKGTNLVALLNEKFDDIMAKMTKLEGDVKDLKSFSSSRATLSSPTKTMST